MARIKVGAFIRIGVLGRCEILELDATFIIVEDENGREHEIQNEDLT